jgi:hypothetical protein
MYRNLSLGRFNLAVNNGLLRASGQLDDPVLLTFGGPATESRVLLWPTGCQTVVPAASDSTGTIHLLGGNEIQAIFGDVVNSENHGESIKLYVTLNSTGCTTNIAVANRNFVFDCLADAFAQRQTEIATLQRQLDTVAVFDKLLRLSGPSDDNLSFWRELDRKCQIITQGRLGVIEYGFGDEHSDRETARQAVLSDLNGAPSLATTTKSLVETTLTQTNLSMMATIIDKLGNDKSLAQMMAQLKSQEQKISAGPLSEVLAEFRYLGDASQGGVSLGRLSFSSNILKTQNSSF